MSSYDTEYIIVGSGIAGMSISEILTRDGHDVILLEGNDKLASGVTREFHEWYHMGSLYTILRDKITSNFVLGALDDLFSFYDSFPNMNLLATKERGLVQDEDGWFNHQYIHFLYRMRCFNLPWSYIVANSICSLENLKNHDWLRWRVGSTKIFKNSFKRIFEKYLSFWNKGEYLAVETPDITLNSRVILNDFLWSSIQRGCFKHYVNSEVVYIEDTTVYTNSKKIKGKYLVLCNGGSIPKFVPESKVQTQYAPLAVVSGVKSTDISFTSLDYFPKNCVNIITKRDDYALAGGITLPTEKEAASYILDVVKKLRDNHGYSNLKIEKIYISKKNEIIYPGQDRNYLYHIINFGENKYYCVPGKFSLSFSLAPEFYRRVYGINPLRCKFHVTEKMDLHPDLSNTVWEDILNSNIKKYEGDL